MKSYDEIFDEIFNLVPFACVHRELIHKKAAKVYAQQVAEDVRKRCAENGECFLPWEGKGSIINESSILETEIILP